MKKTLTIAGSDSSGGAGIQADLKTFSALGVFGMSIITAVTAQNTQGVFGVQDISSDIIKKQIDAIFDDIKVDGIKIGMVSQIYTIKIISDKLRDFKPRNVVLDTVMVSKSGYNLLNPKAKKTLIEELFPLSTIVTPNIPEAETISGMRIRKYSDMEKAAHTIFQMGPKNVLIKGGHLNNDATDILFNGKDFKYFNTKRIKTKNTHGTGCTLSSAITANLAKGHCVEEAVSKAKEYITIAIENSLTIGKGVGPINHFYKLYKNYGLLND